MHIDRWREVVDQIKSNFEVEENEKIKDEENQETKETIIFSGPLGRLKLEFFTRPKVIDKKITYSNRIGSEASVEYIFDSTEKTYQLLVYRWSEADGEWVPFEGSGMFN